jgi:hypothetical protein
MRELRGLAARRGAQIGNRLALDIAEQSRRQRCGGILHPPLTVGKSRKHRHRAVQQRAHGSSWQGFPVQPSGPLRGVGFYRQIERGFVAQRQRHGTRRDLTVV